MPAQKVGGKRLILRPSKRALAVADEVAAAHAAFETHALIFGAAPKPTAAAALAAAESQLGKPYCLAGCRCSPGCSCRDCSGEVIYGVNQAGLAFPCTSSFAIAAFCRDHGTLCSMEEAIHTPFGIGIRNPWATPGINGANGHVWACKGDGKTTVEEGGHRTGCYRGSVFDKGSPLVWALFPGLFYGPSFASRESDMIVQVNKNGEPKPSTIAGRHCLHGISPDGQYVIETNGASVNGDERVASDPPGVRRWYPRNANGGLFLGPGQTYIGLAQRVNKSGIIACRNDGAEAGGDYS